MLVQSEPSELLGFVDSIAFERAPKTEEERRLCYIAPLLLAFIFFNVYLWT